MKNRLLLICLGVCCSTILPNCNRRDIPPPEINVLHPLNGTEVNPGQTISVETRIDDPAGVDRLEFNWVRGANKIRVGKGQVLEIKRQREVVNFTTLHVPESSIDVPKGEKFYLEVKASNPESSKKTHVELEIRYPIDVNLPGFVGYSNRSNRELLFCDGSGTSVLANNLANGVKLGCIGKFYCYNTSSNDIIIEDLEGASTSSKGFPNQELQFIQTYDLLYAVYRDIIVAINTAGEIENTLDMGGATTPVSLAPMEENILVIINSLNQNSRIRKLNRRSGLSVNQQQFANEIAFGVPKQGEEAFLFDTTNSGTDVLLYDETNTLSTLGNISEKIKSVHKLGSHYYAVSTDREFYEIDMENLVLMNTQVGQKVKSITQLAGEKPRLTLQDDGGGIRQINVDGSTKLQGFNCGELEVVHAIN